MKIKEGYVISTIAGEHVVLPSGNDLDLTIMIRLNDSGKFLWEKLQEDKTVDDLIQDVVTEYDDVNKDEARLFIEEFISSLNDQGFLV